MSKKLSNLIKAETKRQQETLGLIPSENIASPAVLAALGSTLVRGIPLENCGCFGGGIHLTAAQAMGLDSILLCLAYCAYRFGSSYAPLDAWIDRGA